jgi:hypothetical protein
VKGKDKKLPPPPSNCSVPQLVVHMYFVYSCSVRSLFCRPHKKWLLPLSFLDPQWFNNKSAILLLNSLRQGN